MSLRDEAVACLRAHAGRVISATELAKLVIAAAPEKYKAKLQRSAKLETPEQLEDQIRREIAAEHKKLVAASPRIRSAIQGKRTRVYEWKD